MVTTELEKLERRRIKAGVPTMFHDSAKWGTYHRDNQSKVEKNYPNRQERRAAARSMGRGYFTKKYSSEKARNIAFHSLPDGIRNVLIRIKRMQKLFTNAKKQKEVAL